MTFFSSCEKTYDEPNAVDIDGNQYPVQRFGDQVWFMSDLKVTHFNNSAEINFIIPNKYTWYEAASDALCPLGWHVPEQWEWITLMNYFQENELPLTFETLGYWWSSTTLVEGYESPEAWAWYQNDVNSHLNSYIELKEYPLSIRCIKD